MFDWEIRARQYAELLHRLMYDGDDVEAQASKMLITDGFMTKNGDWINNIDYFNDNS